MLVDQSVSCCRRTRKFLGSIHEANLDEPRCSAPGEMASEHHVAVSGDGASFSLTFNQESPYLFFWQMLLLFDLACHAFSLFGWGVRWFENV